MPYPVVHVLFFVFCICAAVYAIIRSAFLRELSLKDSIQILFLLSIGSLSALLPDVPAVYNMIVHGSSGHCWIGPFPTHLLLFSFSAFLYGTIAGLIAYGKFGKSVYLGFLHKLLSFHICCWMMRVKELVFICIDLQQKYQRIFINGCNSS